MKVSSWIAVAGMATIVGCADQNKGKMNLIGDLAADNGKTDALKKVKLVDSMAPNSEVRGRFTSKVRVYGYVVDAKRGANLSVSLQASAGSDAVREDDSAPLDTMIEIHGPYTNRSDPGDLIAESDDGDTLSAPELGFEVEEDGSYLVLFSAWEDTGSGPYKLQVGCEGTDFQCLRPEFERPCEAGQLFLQGGAVDQDTTWDKCDVVLLESTLVAEDATLSIKPGVQVRGNYLGTGTFGNVALDVDGTLQAAGTAANPISFTSFKADRGWRGIRLSGRSNTLSHVFIDNANVAIDITNGASAIITDAVLQGIAANAPLGVGVQAQSDVDATFERAVVKGFRTGLHLQNAQRLFVEDSIIRENVDGVRIDGTQPTTSCGNPPVVTTYRDPVFIHTDIVHNSQRGIWVRGHDVLVQVDHCNLVNNGGMAFQLDGRGLDPESFIRNSNIHSESLAGQVLRSSHRAGVLDISSNYWVHISDPELSQSFRATCSGNLNFSGFSPISFDDAGPRESRLVDPVKQETLDNKQQN